MFSACGQANVEYDTLFKCTNSLENPYGITTHITRQNYHQDYELRDAELEIIKELGIQNVRSDIDNYTIRRKDRWESTVIDSALISLNKYNLDYYAVLSDRFPQYPWYNEYAFNLYLSYVIEHFGRNIVFWETFNEPDWVKGEDAIGEKLSPFIKTAYRRIKEVDKSATILSPSICNLDGDFFNYVNNNDLYKYFDVLNIHFYNKPETLISFSQQLKSIMKRAGYNMPVWLTETGHPSSGYKGNDYQQNDELQAKYAARLHLIAYALGYDKVFWYNFRSHETSLTEKGGHFGLVHKGLEPKASYWAYKTLTNYLPNHANRPTLQKCGNIYICTWQRGNKFVAALWQTNSDKMLIKYPSSVSEAVNHIGDNILNKERRISLDDGVVYIVSKREITINNFQIID